MANRDFKPVKALEREVILLAGISTIGSSGAVTATDGVGYSIAETGTTGVYNITLEDKYSKFLFITASLEEATEDTTDELFSVVDSTNASAGTAVIKFSDDAGALAWPDSGAKIHLFMVAKNSSVT